MISLDQAGRALPGARLTLPPPALAEWVSEAWVDDAAGPRWRIVADDAPHLIYSETDAPGGVRRRLALVGARSSYVDIDRSRRRRTVAVRLCPGSLLPLFGVAASEVVDRSVEVGRLGTVGVGRAQECLERTATASDPGPLFDLLAERLDALPSRYGARPDWRVRALPDVRVAGGQGALPGIPLGALCRRLGVSPRTLRLCFAEHVGLPPSTVLRIRRLHRALLGGLSGPSLRPGGWASMAAAAGYADQSHLIRDCRGLMGETPERFRSRAGFR
jgi:AraC-like DNA-binding protein